MQKIIALLIVMLSLFAIGNASMIYKRSYYLESTDRVDLQRLTDRVEQLDHARLLELTRRLVTISRSDAGILFIMNEQFRQALLYLIFCLLAGLGMIVYHLLRDLLASRSKTITGDQ
jgi:hypothetical protein